MGLLEIVVLAVVQGITEFLPISSTGHLRIAATLLHISENTLILDVAVHVGTLAAVLIYFWRDVGRMIAGLVLLARGRRSPGGTLALQVILATLPIVAAGFFGRDYIELNLRTLEIVAWTTIVFGILLWLADHFGMTLLRLEHLTYGNALVIGIAQILALVPGTSRAGITMTAARMLGYERSDAARFSMLLSIPAIAGAGVLVLSDLADSSDAELTRSAVIVGILSFVTALLAIAALMRWLRFAGFGIFAVYRLILGGILLYWVYAA